MSTAIHQILVKKLNETSKAVVPNRGTAAP